MKKIIMLSGKGTSGKNTSADFMQSLLEHRDFKVKQLAFADIIKDFCKKEFNWDGKKDMAGRQLLVTVGTRIIRNYWDKIDNIFITENNKVIPQRKYKSFENRTTLDNLLDLLTFDKEYYGYKEFTLLDIYDKCYKCFEFKNDIFAKCLNNIIEETKNDFDYFIITDHRFKIEYDYMKQYHKENLITCRVINDRVKLINNISETELDDFETDLTIENNLRITELIDTVAKVVRDIVHKELVN